MAPDIDGVLSHADASRRGFLRKLIAGAAFAPPLLASFSLDGLSLTAADAVQSVCANATVPVGGSFPGGQCFDFSGNQYAANFRDVLRGGDINAGPDLGFGTHPALNFTGSAGAAGSTWATVLDVTPADTVPGPVFPDLSVALEADILFHKFNNTKSVGLLTAAFDLVGGNGLALLLTDAGNTDRLDLVTVDTSGKIAPVTGASVSLGSGIAENAWYRLVMEVRAARCLGPSCGALVVGQVFTHLTPSDPTSDLGAQVGASLIFPATLTSSGGGSGQVGIVGRAISAEIGASVTNFCVSACQTT